MICSKLRCSSLGVQSSVARLFPARNRYFLACLEHKIHQIPNFPAVFATFNETMSM